MPVLPNARHEIVAQELAAGRSMVEASRVAGYPDGSSFASNARKRAQRADIRARTAELLAARAARMLDQVEYLCSRITLKGTSHTPN